MTEPLPDRMQETIARLRQHVSSDPAAAEAAPALRDAVLRILDLYQAAARQAGRDDSFLQAWAINFDLEGFTLPNESGARTLLPGLASAIRHLAHAYADDEPQHLFSVPDPTEG
ncbi:hypothetical protein ACF087_34795 [Streptomyces goshikiensis]|uniref:hypothetical protein n=1 Tax=Streptomyces goshikiensis TaxID=1942 RepID=UPI0036FDAD81